MTPLSANQLLLTSSFCPATSAIERTRLNLTLHFSCDILEENIFKITLNFLREWPWQCYSDPVEPKEETILLTNRVDNHGRSVLWRVASALSLVLGLSRFAFHVYLQLCLQHFTRSKHHCVEHVSDFCDTKMFVVTTDFKNVPSESFCFWCWCWFGCSTNLHFPSYQLVATEWF